MIRTHGTHQPAVGIGKLQRRYVGNHIARLLEGQPPHGGGAAEFQYRLDLARDVGRGMIPALARV